ncbi:hypothetical protein ACF1AJ_20590 [Leifsonia sp. NPDC014704]|uniref:hypothetical protein n=1 Tax=Leifsonia sp. NPDC014704 TaxID=3364123 RepID=UPI0036F47934
MADRVPVGCTFTAAEYRALTRIAAERSTPERPVQVHHLIEDLVVRALTRRPETPREVPAPAPAVEAPTRPEVPAEPAPATVAEEQKPKAHRGRPRTKVDRRLLRELHADGMTDSALAEAFGVCKETARAHRDALGLKPNTSRRHTSVDVDLLVKLHAQKLNDREIAAAMGIRRETVGDYRRERLNLPKNTATGRKRTKGVEAA